MTPQHPTTLLHPGVAAALAAAALFGAGTPMAKLLLGTVNPWLLAGLLYLGSGAGLALSRLLGRAERVKLPAEQRVWLAGAVVSGGVLGPLLLMFGLSRMPASGASLLLNAEGVFTALLAWFAFKENFDQRIALGMLAIVAGALALSGPGKASIGDAWPALAVLGACAAWAVDNNLTRKVALADATWIASIKGLVAGGVNLALGLAIGASLPPVPWFAGALILGFGAYGISLTLFVVALRHLGSARTGAYFSVAPFFGAVLAVVWLGEPVTRDLLVAGALMAVGVWLHLTEQHTHVHAHPAEEHDHEHEHDVHHQHEHAGGPASWRHSHPHRHEPLTHAHAHFPDAHHRHRH
ncbi:MAG: DMT family transporter [Betaproteobacteria bacterium]|uniref:DMT family transporter n=1 Tax=Piscinibacter sp. TaxID=1903157 RepID=UPI0011D7EF0B|nr:DMT family transporter [Piscinibacter sp.]MBS0436265.1 DMT family transporter [Pseudomonadota bacterium]MBS0473525.1 DMT family transporter [Pseudomonadota bacterium]TAH43405.1 MAG: DMT family transporter [Betaproteobacteria bacterium]TXH47393.1 MAG: DMT family transporter [Burkholderiaceae bacterium]